MLAISDGAGSAPRAAEGAAFAVGLAVAAFHDRLDGADPPVTPEDWGSLLGDAYRSVLSDFHRATAVLSQSAREFAATLTVAVLAPPWVGVLNVGDSFMILRTGPDSEDESLHLLSFADHHREYANETTFLTSSRAGSAATFDCLYEPDLTAILLATDGLAPVGIVRDRTGREVTNRSFVAQLLDVVGDPHFDATEIARFLLDDTINSVSADDKTVLIAVST